MTFYFKRWKESICFNFLKSFLDLVKSFCIEENEIYQARRELNSNSIKITKITKGTVEYDQVYFLRDWYKNKI
jgi:hypothetical protein